MMSDWPLVRVSEFAEKVAMGPFGSSIKVETFVKEGVPIISGQHLHGVRVKDGQFNFVTQEHASKLSNANVRRGDVVFTHAGNIGQVAVIPEKSKYDRYVISQRQFYLRCNLTRALPDFIAYYFRSPEGQHKLLANTSSSGVPSIARPSSYLKTITVPLPPLAEQRAIAEVLGALDDKIELNERMNAMLDEMARALFKSWFVDFDPVRAKAEGRQPSGMDAATAALFPDSFEDSSIGPIPAGWRMSTVGEAIEVNPRRSLRKGNVAIYVDMASLPTEGPSIANARPREFTSGSRFTHGDTLLARITPCLENGKTAFVDFLAEDEVGWGSTEFIVLRPQPPLPAEFGYLLAREEGFREHAILNMTGSSGRQRVPPDAVANYGLALPDRLVAEAFRRTVALWFALIKSNSEESYTLTDSAICCCRS